MQLPGMNTPVARCLELARFAARMLGKFIENPDLTDLSQRMLAGAQALRDAQVAYDDALDERLLARVDVRFEDIRSDRRIAVAKRLGEIADGRRDGRIATRVFPHGSSPITRRRGESQIAAMRDLEARLQGVVELWPQAVDELAAIAEHRARYETAVQARQDIERTIRDHRVARDAAKQTFLDLYAEIASLVKATFPRDRVMQDVFFDEVRRRSRTRRTEGEPDQATTTTLHESDRRVA